MNTSVSYMSGSFERKQFQKTEIFGWIKEYIQRNRKVKLQRANGGCLGTDSRRRTCKAAISHGELLKSLDPWESEWGNPAKLKLSNPYMNQ